MMKFILHTWFFHTNTYIYWPMPKIAWTQFNAVHGFIYLSSMPMEFIKRITMDKSRRFISLKEWNEKAKKKKKKTNSKHPKIVKGYSHRTITYDNDDDNDTYIESVNCSRNNKWKQKEKKSKNERKQKVLKQNYNNKQTYLTEKKWYRIL